MMPERRKKITIEQLRTLFPFDVPKLAQEAGVANDTLYLALQLYPIGKQDAEKIITALAQHTGLPLSFDHLDIVVWEEFLMLWIVRASNNEPQNEGGETEDAYTFVYARSQKHAAILARSWLKQFPHLSHYSFTACPQGFQIGDITIPGHRQIEMDVV